jgi:hypothetical protein
LTPPSAPASALTAQGSSVQATPEKASRQPHAGRQRYAKKVFDDMLVTLDRSLHPPPPQRGRTLDEIYYVVEIDTSAGRCTRALATLLAYTDAFKEAKGPPPS